MRYKLQRNANGMITQCENADGGNIYAQREELNKKALENLQRPTPGKLGNLSNLQIFNANISSFGSGTEPAFLANYNTTNTFPANATQTLMFGVDGLNNKALYYNLVSVNAVVTSDPAAAQRLTSDSYIQFYLLQNIETSTTSLGTKIPQPAPFSGNGGGSVTFSTTGNINGNQFIDVQLADSSSSSVNYGKGLRCSGVALKRIFLNFEDQESIDGLQIDLSFYVDVSSVSSTY